MTTKTLDALEIKKILPHRYPFLLVDKVIDLDLEQGTIVAQKCVTVNEEFFQGHFPNAPIMPGVLVMEALAQAGGILVHLKSGNGKIALLLSVKNAKFRRPVKPGDVLIMKGTGIHFGSKSGRVKAEAFVDDKLVVEAEIGFAMADPAQV